MYLLRAEIRPTPRPAKKRPARNRGTPVAAVCSTTPKIKTKEDTISANRRPIVSPSAGLERDPKKVPAERMDTMAEDSDGVTSRWPDGL